MEVTKIVGIGLVTVIISVVLKEYKKEYAIYVGLLGSIILLVMTANDIKEIFNMIKKFTDGTSVNTEYIKLLLKITGISILIEYAVALSKDAGENSIASKIDLAGKVIIISMSIPIINSTLLSMVSILP